MSQATVKEQTQVYNEGMKSLPQFVWPVPFTRFPSQEQVVLTRGLAEAGVGRVRTRRAAPCSGVHIRILELLPRLEELSRTTNPCAASWSLSHSSCWFCHSAGPSHRKCCLGKVAHSQEAGLQKNNNYTGLEGRAFLWGTEGMDLRSPGRNGERTVLAQFSKFVLQLTSYIFSVRIKDVEGRLLFTCA